MKPGTNPDLLETIHHCIANVTACIAMCQQLE
jgi:hypothetical protein